MTDEIQATPSVQDPNTGEVVDPDFNGRSRPDLESLVPAMPGTSAARTPWLPQHFNPLVTRSGAVKLAASGIAPLVAAARGYESVDKAQAKDFAKNWGIGDGRSKKGSQFLASFRDDGDVLVMPWYRAGQSRLSALDFVKPSPDSLQIRPENPRISDVSNKPVKYEFLVGEDTVIDYHPAVTHMWLSGVRRTMIAEGLLKGDSALSAQLRHHVGDAELYLVDGDYDRLKAMTRLAGLMDRIPPDERVGILNIAGVGNWRSNPEWSLTDLKGQEVLIAFDADVKENWNVWNMAKDLFNFVENSRKATPYLIAIHESPAGGPAVAGSSAKIGLDDFFYSIGDWSDLDSMLVPELPERPARGENDVADDLLWRVTEDGCAVEECKKFNDPEGNLLSIRWLTRVRIGGRISRFETRRAATRGEIAGRAFGYQVVPERYPLFCTVTLSWRDDATDQVISADVTGPGTILNYPPAEWVRYGAVLPKALLRHPEWPPHKGPEWLQAIKGNNSEDVEDLTIWTTMGWVPVENEDTQAFIVGNDIVAISDAAAKSTMPGVDENLLAGSTAFGVDDVYTGPGFTDPAGKYNLVADIKEIYGAYITDGPWKTPQQAMTMLAAALRPTVPLPTSVACYFVGAPQQGKSWTAKRIMAFWQHEKNSWESLPGSASDTYASTENAVSKTPIWVVDDFAPTADRRVAESMESSIGSLIRAVNNNLSKRRMNMDMTAQAVPTPMALLILTAENEHSMQSIRERVVNVEFTGLVSKKMGRLNKLSARGTTASRVTAAILRMYIQKGAEAGWQNMVRELVEIRDNAIEEARKLLMAVKIAEADASRPAEIIGDLSMGLAAFAELAEMMGLYKISDAFGWGPGDGCLLITEQVSYGHLNKSDVSPGRVLLDSIRNLLAAGKGHIARMDKSGVEPYEGADFDLQNALLGWSRDGQGIWRPRGTTIGYVAPMKKREGEEAHDIIYLSRDDAFNEAQRAYPKRIQHGVDPTTSWRNVWDLNLVDKSYGRPKHGVVVQFRSGGARPYGVPVNIDILFPPDANEVGGDEQSIEE